jgi:predicted nucleotidyltransferase
MRQNTEVIDYFLQEVRKRLGARLKQVILFGSRARGDDVPDSDYDCLMVLDAVSPATKDAIDEIAGEILYRHNIVLSIFPVSEKKHYERIYDPFLMNIRKEGITLWTSTKS